MADWLHQNFFDMLQNTQVVTALQAGTIVALVCAVIGYFVVLRGLSFLGHAITDIGFTGGAEAGLLGMNALWGLLVFCVAAALAVGAFGDRARERDVATGVILSLALGIGALFLYISTRFVSEPFTLLFGSIFEVDPDTTRVMIAIGGICLLVVIVLFRPLLFCSLNRQLLLAAGREGLAGIVLYLRTCAAVLPARPRSAPGISPATQPVS